MRINQSWGEKSSQQSLFICSPSYNGDFSGHFVTSLIQTIDLLKKNNVTFHIYFSVFDSLVARSRNDLADKFLQSECDRMLMIDSDQGWEPEAVLKMLEYKDAFITGAVPGRQAEETYALRLHTDEERTPFGTDDGLFEAETNGVAFAMIHREVFRLIREKYPYNHLIYPYFQHKYYENGDHYGEDTFFVKTWQEFGKVWIYPDITFTHGPITANFLKYLEKQPRNPTIGTKSIADYDNNIANIIKNLEKECEHGIPETSL